MTDTSTQPLPEGLGSDFITGLHATLSGAADALGDLDRRAGDGDFGTNVRTAMKLATGNLEADAPTTYRQWVSAMSMAWLGVGGTSGPLFGMFFRDLAKAGEEGAVPTLAQLADALAAGQAVVQKYGEAEVGDKTMIDSLAPAIAALREAIEAGAEPAAALADAERAAVEAARATADSTARRGRASYVGEVSKGVIDPGAAAMALVIGAARAAVDGGEVETGWIS
ncbi:dihydroxyacetone kinase subunit L [Brachybacterium ginsengisoli]|uniref:Dihydroxyacetone kinase subunit L n=1 Tax=Brachybacterium ginsengisoli TaxID=1331682 RepID=A0A291H1F7_9MICO|nr:dihydroxyacetone kinase subunit DhaL [Brachybacterium ginsengisoli]ATG56220.1 dihydroxyacetone kinase subunit L [Brachybacterium ginsengisoli]